MLLSLSINCNTFVAAFEVPVCKVPQPVPQFNLFQLNEWNQVGATYDNTTGVAQLWHNGKMVKSRNIGQIKLATQYPIRIGARDGDDRRFAGKISCLQIYDKALDEQQIGNLKSCPVKGSTAFDV